MRSQRPTTAAMRCGVGRKLAAVTATGEKATAATMLSTIVRKQQSRRGSNNQSDSMWRSKEATDRSKRQPVTTMTGEKRCGEEANDSYCDL
ncbi:hypothetical protein ACOSQ3_022267 [Xanthoceras sorbifolium]